MPMHLAVPVTACSLWRSSRGISRLLWPAGHGHWPLWTRRQTTTAAGHSSRRPQATARTGHRPRWDWEENAWWALYRKEMPEEDYGTLSRTLKALAAEQESGKPACETGGGVSDEPVRRD